LARLQSEAPEGGVSVSVELTHYRLEETGTQTLTLGDGELDPLTAIRGDGTGAGATGQIPMGVLGELVESFNARYGGDLSEADVIKPLEHIVQRVVDHEGMAEQAKANDLDDFKRGKEGLLIDATLDVQDISGKLLQTLLNDEALRERAFDGILEAAYEQLRSEPAA
jgi:type I restriction enzyme, R subunit